MKKFILALAALMGLSSALSPVLQSNGSLHFEDTVYTSAYSGPQTLQSTRLHFLLDINVLSRYENMIRTEGTRTSVAFYTPLIVFQIDNHNYYYTVAANNIFLYKPLRAADGRHDLNGWSAGSDLQNFNISGFIDIPGDKAFIGSLEEVKVNFVRPVVMFNPNDVMYEISGNVEARLIPVFTLI